MSNTPRENQLARELLGVVALNPFVAHTSSPRSVMFSGHLSQALVVSGSTERKIQTGMEREYGKYTFSIKIPGNPDTPGGVEIIKMIQLYPQKIGVDVIKFNPQTLVIYEDVTTKEIGMISVPRYCSYHQYFGFEYSPKEAMENMRVGSFLPYGTILMDSPSVTEDGGYKYGVECNVAFMSHPSVSEDGIMVSRDILKKFKFKTFETRTVDWGGKRFPLNLYGDKDKYKPFPDIGDTIRPDGLLMCLRTYDKELSVVEQSINDTLEPDYIFDKLMYAGGAGGTVIDIRVHHDIKDNEDNEYANMDAQADKYNFARYSFYQELVSEYYRLKRLRGESLRLTPELHRMVVEGLAVIDKDPQRISKLYRKSPLDDYRVEFVIEYEIEPTTGFKLTDGHGGKGVVCHIEEPENMPIDSDGNRADVVMDSLATVSRMNIGRLYEQYINSASRDVVKTIRTELGLNNCAISVELLDSLEQSNEILVEKAWEYLLEYYRLSSPKMYIVFTDGEYMEKRTVHLESVLNKGIYLYMPPSNSVENDELVTELEKYFRPTYGPVTYTGTSGIRVTTKLPVRIGSMYIMLLEKTADDWTAVSSGKLQHFGVLSQVTNNDKYSQPSRNQAIRALGESEVRIYASYVGGKVTADLLDRNNSPSAHLEILRNILRAKNPTNIDIAINRNVVPVGKSKPLGLISHMSCVAGYKFVYKPYVSKYNS